MANKLGKLKIAVLAGGPSSEHEISLASAKSVISALRRKGHSVKAIKITKKGDWQVGHYKKSPKQALESVDVVFNALHGEYGEDGIVQAILERMKMPYTGPTPVSAALAIDKTASRKLFSQAKLHVPKAVVLRKSAINNLCSIERGILNQLNLPVVVKPNSRGSSVGVNIVNESTQISKALFTAFKYDDLALAEQFIPGVEVTCGVIATKSGLMPLPPVMIVPLQGKTFFDYQAKYDPKFSKEVVPAPLGFEINKKIREAALKAHEILGLRHYSRTDMILSGDKLYVLETNSLPGLTENSLLPKSLSVWGMSMPEFVEHVVMLALTGR